MQMPVIQQFEMNVHAKEFKPKLSMTLLEKVLKEKIFFDKLENEFIKKNQWLFE